MQTRWFKILKALRSYPATSGNFGVQTLRDYRGNSYSTNTNGTISTSYYANSFDGGGGNISSPSALDTARRVAICIGTGDTPATETDYNLDNLIELTYVGKGSAPIVENGAPIGITLSTTYQNNTGENVVIKEIGVFVKWYYNSTSSETFLIERSVLENPVTLADGEVITVTFKMY